jgi:predicted ATPase
MARQIQSRSKEPKLKQLTVRGFRSIAEQILRLGDLNVLIGPNGAGKSNLIGFCRMLRFMLSSDQGLATYVGQAGGASALLYEGPKITPQIEAHFEIETDRGLNEYRFRLGYAADDTFIFLEEKCRYSDAGRQGLNPYWIDLGAGHRSPQLLRPAKDNLQKTQHTILHLLHRLAVYQFHDTSDEARIKQRSPVDDNRYLRGDAGNIASFLLGLRQRGPQYYIRIVETIRQLAPFFDDFVLEPEYDHVILRWREVGSDLVFGPRQASDGSLRAISLITLLLQPPGSMPSIIVLDEPELGLHPFAVRIVAGLIRSVSVSRQCIIATQSPDFLDQFNAEEIIVVERVGRATQFRRLAQADLERWLTEYSLSELWDMNVLGGRPRPPAAAQ